MTVTSWHDQISVHPLGHIAALDGHANGQLPDAILVPVYRADGLRIGRLVKSTARAWAAMVAAAKVDGVLLDATDTYRPLDIQENLWDTRYDHTDHGLGGRTCGHDHRFLKPHCAVCACPGTSNHGWARAVDDKNTVPEHGLTWLEVHAQTFGWQWEVPSEPWHLQNFAGDALTQAVLDFEQHNGGAPDVPQEDEMDVIKVTAGTHEGEIWYRVGNRMHKIDQDHADRLTGKSKVTYREMDDESFAQVLNLTDVK